MEYITSIERIGFKKGMQQGIYQEILQASKGALIEVLEALFDHMQSQFDGLKDDLKDFRGDVDRRFDTIKSGMDQRFGQVDKRFEQINKRFDQVIASIERLMDKLDYRDEKQRGFTLGMFSIAIGIFARQGLQRTDVTEGFGSRDAYQANFLAGRRWTMLRSRLPETNSIL